MKIPPTREQVETYCKIRGNKVNVDKFMLYYEENEWTVSDTKRGKDKKKPMTSWKLSVLTWEDNMSASHSISSVIQRDEAVKAEKKVYSKPLPKPKSNPEIRNLISKQYALAGRLRGATSATRIQINYEIREIGKEIVRLKDGDSKLKSIINQPG